MEVVTAVNIQTVYDNPFTFLKPRIPMASKMKNPTKRGPAFDNPVLKEIITARIRHSAEMIKAILKKFILFKFNILSINPY